MQPSDFDSGIIIISETILPGRKNQESDKVEVNLMEGLQFQTLITLQPGEKYVGSVLNPEGLTLHYLILLPGDAADLDWEAAKTWAAEHGGELPTRQEQSLLFANLKAEFQPEWYWSGQQHERYGSLAWNQDFRYGFQGNNVKSFQARARAIRRVVPTLTTPRKSMS